ncbi:hypothetical protein NL676_027228 [Syzygium grande]|nr:hypothetical protein NL676_027228 [Syzygium grande]
MAESLLGVGLKLHLRRLNRRAGGVKALLRISLFAWFVVAALSSGTTYPWRPHWTDPGFLEHVQACRRRGGAAGKEHPRLRLPRLSPANETDLCWRRGLWDGFSGRTCMVFFSEQLFGEDDGLRSLERKEACSCLGLRRDGDLSCSQKSASVSWQLRIDGFKTWGGLHGVGPRVRVAGSGSRYRPLLGLPVLRFQDRLGPLGFPAGSALCRAQYWTPPVGPSQISTRAVSSVDQIFSRGRRWNREAKVAPRVALPFVPRVLKWRCVIGPRGSGGLLCTGCVKVPTGDVPIMTRPALNARFRISVFRSGKSVGIGVPAGPFKTYRRYGSGSSLAN